MTEELKEAIAELLEVEVEEISSEKKLTDFEIWDSVTALSLTVLISDVIGAPVMPEEMKGLESISDIEALIASKQE